jgi:hypothetical protein
MDQVDQDSGDSSSDAEIIPINDEDILPMVPLQGDIDMMRPLLVNMLNDNNDMPLPPQPRPQVKFILF